MSIDTVSMKDLESERKLAAQGGKTRRVKIEKGESWLLRFIPFPMGKERTFYARLAYHWLHKKPILCLRNTAQAFGGNPEFECPLCAVAERLYEESPSEAVRDFAYRAMGHKRWKTWCIVTEIDDGRRREAIDGDELYIPYEFDLSKTTFDGLSGMILRSRGRKGASEQGVIDLETGCDIWATRLKNAIQLDRSDEPPGPILGLTDGKQFDDVVARIWKGCKSPRLTIPSDRQLDDAAGRLEESAIEEAHGGRRRGRWDDDGGSDDGGDDRFSRRSNRRREYDAGDEYDSDRRDSRQDDRDRPRARQRDDQDDRQERRSEDRTRESRDDRQERAPAPRSHREESAEAPPPRSRREEQEPAPRTRREEPEPAPRSRREEPEPSEAPPPRRGQVERANVGEPEPPQDDSNPDLMPAERGQSQREGDEDVIPAPRRTLGAKPSPPPARRTEAPPARRTSAPPAASGAGASESSVSDEEDNAPEERRDAAPARRERVEEQAERTQGDAPPRRVNRESALSGAIRNSISSMRGNE